MLTAAYCCCLTAMKVSTTPTTRVDPSASISLLSTSASASFSASSIKASPTSHTTVTIVSNPAGTAVSGSINTFDYPILSSVTLTCMVDHSPSTTITYQWNTTECYTNINYNNGEPGCFPHNQTTQSVTGYSITAENAGTITCTVTISGVQYTSEPLSLRISGLYVQYSIDSSVSNYSS